MENNPQLAQVLNDPAMMRQYLDMARNPEVNEREERAACVSCLRFVLRGGFRGGFHHAVGEQTHLLSVRSRVSAMHPLKAFFSPRVKKPRGRAAGFFCVCARPSLCLLPAWTRASVWTRIFSAGVLVSLVCRSMHVCPTEGRACERAILRAARRRPDGA